MKHRLAVLAGLALAACSNAAPSASATEAGPETAATATPAAATPRGSADPSASGSHVADPRTCTNEEIGFTVDYPADWWVNERIEPDFEGGTPIPACTYFAPEEVELQPNAGLPPGIAIWFDLETQFEITSTELSREETEIDGRRTLVVETEGTGGGFDPEGSRTYRYIIDMGEGSELLVTTSSVSLGDAEYEDAMPILDAMMETLDFTE